MDKGNKPRGKRLFVFILLLTLIMAMPAWAYGDIDGDGISDSNDNCVFTSNSDQLDLNGNNIGDACEDYIALMNQALCCTRLSPEVSPETSSQNCGDVTQYMENGPPFVYYSGACSINKNKGKYDILSVRADVDSTQLSSLTLSIFIAQGEIDSQFPPPVVHVYAYNADADSIQSSIFLEFSFNAFGWYNLDITPLLPLMDGFGFVKVRIVSLQKTLDIGEAYLRVPPPTNKPDISVNPTSLDFGTIDVGMSSSLSFTVSNDGNADLVIGTITNPSAPFSITSDGCSGQTITPSASCSVTVELAPASGGTFADSVQIPSNDPDSPNVTVTLNGAATSPPLDNQEITVAPTTLNYGAIDVGVSSSLSLTVSNIGTAGLVIGTVADPSTPYSVTSDGCSGQTLIPSASCSITVKFAPTAEGTFADTMTIPSNDADNPNIPVTIHGIGTLPITTETIRPTGAYNPGGWIYVPYGYDGNLSTYSYKNTPDATPSISFGGSSSNATVNAWQSKSKYWNAAWISIVFERGPANDDTVEVVVTDQNGNLKHSILTATNFNVQKEEFAIRLNMSDWGDGFSNINNLRVRVNGQKKKGADGAESRVYDVKIIGDSAPFVKDFTRGKYISLPVDAGNLATDYVPDEIDDVKSDDDVRVSQNASANQYPIHQFKLKSTTQNASVKWSGQTSQGFEAYAHSFAPNNTGSLNRVDIWLEKVGLPDGTLRARIKSELGGKVLAESNNIAETSIGISGGWKTFTFNTPPSVIAGNTYYLELWRDKADSNNYPKIVARDCDSGFSLWYRNGGNWIRHSHDAFSSLIYINDVADVTQSGCTTPILDDFNMYGLDWKNIYIEAYNRTTSSWDILNSVLYDGSTNDINLSGNLFSSNYFDANNWVAVRAYAGPGANSFNLATDSIEITSLLDTWEISAVPASLAFGSIDVNTTSSSNFALSNTGIGNLVIGTITNPSAPFSVTSDGCSGQTLIASASCSVTVEFTPAAEGSFTGSLTIPSNDADNPNVTVNLNGTAISATLTGTVTDSSTSLSIQNAVVTVTDSLSNIYSTTLDLRGIYTVSGLARDNFTATFEKLDYFDETTNGTLTAGQTQTLYVQMSPIALDITSPADGAVLDLSPVTVTGVVKSNSTVTVNGVPATVTGNDFSVVIPLNEGQNSITAEAIDQSSQTTTDSITVTFVPPITVTITSPTDGAVLNSSPVTVTGNVHNAAGSGGYAEAHAQSFKPLASGALEAISVILLRSGSPGGDLYMKITTMPGGSPVAVSSSVSAMSVDPTQLYWKTFNFSAPLQVTAGNTYYMEIWRTERDDVNHIEWWKANGLSVMTDFYPDGMAYRSDSGTWTDLGPYVDATFRVYINSVADVTQEYWTTAQSQLTIYGINPYPVDVTINGVQATVTGDSFSATVALNEGSNTITASASDLNGHTSSDIIGVTLISKGSIAGTVMAASTGQPVQSANVSVTDSLNNTQSTQTASDGAYTINGIEPGAFSGSMTKSGYIDYNFSGTVSAGQTITINAALTPAPPAISNITVSNITNNSATITWTTDWPSDSLVDYGTTTLYGSSASDPALTTNHSIALTNLNPGTMYHFIVTSANSKGASSSADNTFMTLSPITVTIISPSNNDTINRADVMVRGIVTNSTGNETGMTVNGMVATVYNGEFFANHVPLQEGQNTITANAVDTAGNSASHSIL